MPCVLVNLPSNPYSITIEPGLLASLGECVRGVAPHAKAFLVVDQKIAGSHGRVAEHSLRASHFDVIVFEAPASESQKTLETVRSIYEAMTRARLERSSPVIALGGGVVGDMTGFAAATYLRGLPFIQAPTTLLAMADASIGGKTGVNFPLPGGVLGKNLIGAFWQPGAVLADPETLRTLTPRDFRCGLAECIKLALIRDASLLEFIEANAEAVLALDMTVLVELIHRAASIKAEIVAQDERETGVRALLNLGHTFAHVIEPIEALDLRHGEAVAIGLCAAAHCAVRTKRLKEAEQARIQSLLNRLHLPTCLPQPLPVAQLIEAMGYDKKVAAGKMRLILVREIGAAEIVSDIPMSTIEPAWLSVGAGR